MPRSVSVERALSLDPRPTANPTVDLCPFEGHLASREHLVLVPCGNFRSSATFFAEEPSAVTSIREEVVVTLSNRAPHATPGPVRSTLAAVAVAAVLAACGAGSTGSAPPSTAPAAGGTSGTTPATPSATPSPAPSAPTRSGRQLAISVTGRSIDPPPAQVDLGVGETLTLTVTIDHDDLLHAHGFEIEKTLTAAAPTTIVLTGAEPGVYEVETHEPALTLLTIAVR